jgi:50S ribosome-binding GTPase
MYQSKLDGEAVSTLSEITADQQREIRNRLTAESEKPLTVAIMGQTGTGKSSLLNALFGTSLLVGDVRPTTKFPEPVTVAGLTGHPLTFWDMPGIGESDSADRGYLEMYREKLIQSDVVLWAMHADSRSTLFDATALDAMLAGIPSDDRRVLVSRMTFVLTKADLITPPAWIYVRDGATGTFLPSRAVSRRLAEKSRYYQETLIMPRGALQSSETYLSDGFTVADRHFECDEYHVRYSGFMSAEVRDEYTQRYPQFSAVFHRLSDNHEVIPCSSLYRYNLTRLMIAIVNKLGENAIGRFQRLIDGSGITSMVPVDQMRDYGNIVIWDKQRGAKTFDLAELKLD